MQRKLSIVFLIGLMILIFKGSLIAETQKRPNQNHEQDSDLSVRLGAIGLYKPAYEGSDDYEFQGLPMIDINWRDTIFLNLHNGLGAFLWKRHDIKIGVSIGYASGRDEDDSSDLDGLGDIDDGATGNILFEWKIEDISFKARYEQQFTGEDTGHQIHIDLGYDQRLGNKIMFKTSVKTTFANSDYMEQYFSVSQSQSLRSGLPVYDSGPGIKSAGVQVVSIYSLNRRWSVLTIARYHRLVADTADSPVVKDEDQYLLILGLSYMF